MELSLIFFMIKFESRKALKSSKPQICETTLGCQTWKLIYLYTQENPHTLENVYPYHIF